MQTMIEEYQENRRVLRERIHALNEQMRNEKLDSQTVLDLEMRRDLLAQECTELLHSIMEMQAHSHREEASLHQC